MLVALLLTGATARAQDAPPDTDADRPGERVFQVLQPTSHLSMIELQSRVVELPSRIKIVDGFDPEIVTVTALSPSRLRLHAERPGVTSVVLTDEFDQEYTVDVFVEGDTRELQAYLQRLFPGSAIEAIRLRDSIVLRGWVTEPDQIPQVIAVASQFTAEVHNQLRVAGENQVMLKVRILEVQRSKLQELGFNFLSLGEQYFLASTPAGLFNVPALSLPLGPVADLTLPGSNASTLQFAITGDSHLFSGFIEALRRDRIAKILAEPVLVTTSGRPANILAGGEFPVPVPAALGQPPQVDFREFGVRMEAVPIVLGNGRLRLDIAPEFSQRDFANAFEVDGLVIPGLATRRVNTQVEMRFGETLVIGGLISSVRIGTVSKVPVLGELPWIGAAFRRVEYDDAETELVIMVTPHLVRPLPPGMEPCGLPGFNSADPTTHELYIDGMLEVDRIGPEVGFEEGGPYSASPIPPYGTAPPSAPMAPPDATPPYFPTSPPPSGGDAPETPASTADAPSSAPPGLIEPTGSGGRRPVQLLAPSENE